MSGAVPEGIRSFLQAPSPFRPSSSACYLLRRGTHPLDRRSSVLFRSQQRGSDLIVWVDTTISSSKQACWWQPSIPEEVALWDEDWEKFEDEGFANDLTFDTKNASSKPKPVVINGEQSFNEDHSVGPPMSANGKHESSTNGDYTVGDETAYARSEDGLGRSPPDSPAGKTIVESLQEFSNAQFRKSTAADAETNRLQEKQGPLKKLKTN